MVIMESTRVSVPKKSMGRNVRKMNKICAVSGEG